MSETKNSIKKNKIYQKAVMGIIFQVEELINDNDKSEYENKYTIAQNEYIGRAFYNDERGKFQAWVLYNGRKTSLSFFPTKKAAFDNIENMISYLNGGQGAGQINNSVGD